MSRDYIQTISTDAVDEILDELNLSSDHRKESTETDKSLVNLFEHGYNMALENFRTALEERGTVYDVLKENLLEQNPSTGPRVYISDDDKIPAQAYPVTYVSRGDGLMPQIDDNFVTIGLEIKDMPDEIAVNDVFYKKE